MTLKFNTPLLFWLFLFCIISKAGTAQDASEIASKASEKYDQKKYKDAVDLYTKAIKLAPDSSNYYLSRSDAHLAQGNSTEAFSDINQAIKVDPENYKGYYDRAYFFYLINKSDKSILDYTTAYKLVKKDTIKYHILVNRSSSKLQKRDFTGAIEDCETVLKFDSLHVGALNNLAMALADIGEGKKTLAILKKIVRIDSTASFAIMNIGFYLSNEGEYEESLPYFDKAIELSPKMAYNYNNRGYSKYKLKMYDEALEDINKSIKMDPSNSYAYRNRGLVYQALGKKEKSCADWDTAIRYGFTKTHGPEVKELIEKNCL